MELELGLKITKTRDDIDSISEYQLMKDTGPVFKSRETNTMFILTAHIKGYKRNNIDINISKDGNKISIRGKKPIQEMVMMGWVMQRKVVDVKGFNKVFKIPYGVNLDKIKANYNEEEWMLNIVMPKLVKGVCGLKIEEIKEQEFDKERIEQGKSDFEHVSSSVGETSQKGSKEFEYQHMEGSENIIGKMIDDTKKEINEEGIQKEVGEYKLRIEDGNGERSVREKGGKEENEVSKKMEIDRSVGVFMSKEIEDTSQDKEFENQKLNSRNVDKRHDDVNRDLIGSTTKKDKEESKDSKVKDTSQLVFEESIIQQSGESKQKEFEEPKCESKVRVEESSKEPFEAMKVPKLNENVVDHIPNNGCINQTQLKEEYEKPPFEAYEDVQKTIFEDTIQKESIRHDKEGFDAKITINEEFPKNLPKNNQKMQETKNEKEETVSKEVEYFAEKGEGERLKMMHVEARKGNNTTKTLKKESEESDNEIKENDKQQVAEIEGSKSFNDAKKEEQKEVMKESLVENESLIVEGDESKERTNEIVQEEEEKIENSIVKLKGEGSTKMHVEPNELFEGENVNNEIFDGRDTKMFHEVEQTKDVNEKGANEDLPMKFFDSPIDTREGKKNTRIEKVKGIKESEKESSMKPFEANEDVHKDFVKPKMESKDGDQESLREKPNKERVEAEIKEEIQNCLPISTREQNEGLNVQKRQKIKDVKENVVRRKGKEIEYFVEDGEGDRLKSMHVKEMKGNNTIETMQDELEKSEYGITESSQQHANENTVKEMYDVSKSDTEELPRQVAEIDGSKEFDVAKEKEKNEVLNEALVESGSLVEMLQGEESNQMTKAIVRDDEDKIEYNIEKLKEKGPAKINFEPSDPFEGGIAEEKIEKEIRNQNLESTNELSEKENANVGIFDGKKENKFQEMKQTEDVKEISFKKIAKTVNEKIQNEENEDLKKNNPKEKDECCLQEEKSEGRCQANKSRKEDFSMKMLDSQINAREGPKDREMEKTKGVKEESAKVKRVKYEKIQVEENDGLRNDITKGKQNESEETKLETKFKDQQSLQKEKSKGRNEASTIERELPMKTIDSLARSREGQKDKEIDKQNFVESTTKEEFQRFEIETSKILFEELEENNSKAKEIETPERVFQSVASTGFKEFDYVNAKDKKQNMKMLPPKFQSKETHESKDESINQDILNQKKTKEGGKQCREQFEYEEKDKSCEGSKAKYEEFLASERRDHKKDIQNFIEMKKKEEVEQNDTLKQEIPQEKELKKEEKCEILNGETMREKTDEPKNKYKNLNANDENFKTHGEITKEGIENEKCIHETMKTTQEKEAEPLESSLKNDIAEMKTKKPLELENTIVQWQFPKTKDQHDYGTEEMKIKAIGEENVDSLQPQFLDGKENVLQKKEQAKLAKIEDKHASTLQREIRKTTQTIGEKKHKVKEIATSFEKASESKRVEEKVHDTPHRELQREIQEVTSKMVEPYTTFEKNPTKKGEGKDPQELTRPNKEYEISKVEEVRKENEVESRIYELEATIYKEEETHANEEVESMEASLNNDSLQHEQHESGTEEIKEPKKETYQKAKTSKLQKPKINQQSSDELNRKSEENVDSLPPNFLDEQEEALHVQEKNDKKGFHTPNTVEEERFVKKREGLMVAKNEETDNSSTLKRVSGKSKTKEENKPKMKEITTEFEKAKGSKRVEEKVHQTPKRERHRELEEVTSKIEGERKEPLELTSPPNMVNEILKVEEKHEEKEGQKHIQVLEATIAKGKEDRGNQYVQEKNNKKGFQTQKTLEEEKVVKKMKEEKVAKSEETKDDSTFKRQDGKTTEASKFDKASSGSKRVGENIHETSKRNHQREFEEVTSEMDNEIPKVKEFRKEELERHIQELEANISKEKDRVEAKDKIHKQQLNHFPSPKEPFQQFEFEGKGKTKKNGSKLKVQESTKSKAGQEIEQGINKDMEAKHGIEEQKECEDETTEEKKYNKIPNVEEEKKVKRHIQVQEATISKEKDRVEQKEDTSNQLNSMLPKNSSTEKHHSVEDTPTLAVVADKVVQQLEVPSTSCTQQFEVEGEEKAKERESKIDVHDSKICKRGQESEQCIDNDEEAKHGIEESKDEEKDYEQVLNGQKEGECETREGKKDNAKISKEFFVPLVIAGSTLIVTVIALFVRQRRARKR